MDEWAAYLGGERGQEVRVTSRGHEPRTLYGRRSTTPREPRNRLIGILHDTIIHASPLTLPARCVTYTRE